MYQADLLTYNQGPVLLDSIYYGHAGKPKKTLPVLLSLIAMFCLVKSFIHSPPVSEISSMSNGLVRRERLPSIDFVP